MSTVAFFLEEKSAKAFLENFIPRFFTENYEYIYFAFEGKQDLIRQLPRKLMHWQKPDT